MPQRRLSARRGSITAPDPYGTHTSINDAPNRTSQSKLTIVRVLSPPPPSPNAPLPASDAPSSPSATSFNVGLAHSLSSRRRRPGSVGSVGSIGGASSPPATDSPPPGRLSFAFSSFGPSDGPGDHHRSGSGGPHPSSPTSSPRQRPTPGSPRLSAVGGYVGAHHGAPGKPRLTPDQLVDLARQATNPRTLAQIASHSTGVSPGASPSPGSPVLRPPTPTVAAQVAPATFTPLPDDIYLPFIDRPGEVGALISTVPDAKLFALLSQTLPKEYTGPAYEPPSLPTTDTPASPPSIPALSSSVSTTSSSAPLTSPSPFATFPSTVSSASSPTSTLIRTLPPDPALWTHAHLLTHLTVLDRDRAPDPVWVAAARRCIRTHSELIWERVKGGLGVPPELDVDWDFSKVGYQTALDLSTAAYGSDDGADWMVMTEGGMKRRGSHRKGSTSAGRRERTDSVKMGERMRRLRAELREGAPKQRLGAAGREDESALDVEEHDEDDVQVPPHLAKRWAGLQQGGSGSGSATPTRERPHGLEGATTAGAFAHRAPAPVDEHAGGMVIGEFSEEMSVDVQPEVRVQVTRPSGDDSTVPTPIDVQSQSADPQSALSKDKDEHEDLDASSFEEPYSEGEFEDLDDDDLDEDEEGDGGGEDEGGIEIEPILAPSDLGGVLGANAPPPLSHATKELLEAGVATDVPAAEGVGLGDIMEGEEDEEEGEEEETKAGAPTTAGEEKEKKGVEAASGVEAPKDGEGAAGEEEDLIDPTQIQGLRISTAPVHAAGWYGAGGGLYVPHAHPGHLSPNLTDNHGVASPMPLGDGEVESRTLAGGDPQAGLSSSTGSLTQHIISPPAQRGHSRTSSFSSLSGVSIGPFSRAESSGSLAKDMGVGPGLVHGHYATSYGAAFSGAQGSVGSVGGGSAYGSDVDGYGSDWSAGATQGSLSGFQVIGGAGKAGEEKVGDRKPGEPLFVSNFARLNGCPTLSGQGSQQAKSKNAGQPHRFKLKRAGRETVSGAQVVGSVPYEKFLGGGRSV